MLRFQQYIELVRTQDQAKLVESINHAKKFLLPYRASYPREVQQACGLLAFPPGTRAPAYTVSISCGSTFHYLRLCRYFTVQNAGRPSLISSLKHTIHFSLSPPRPYYISLYLPVFQPSKHPHATPKRRTIPR